MHIEVVKFNSVLQIKTYLSLVMKVTILKDSKNGSCYSQSFQIQIYRN